MSKVFIVGFILLLVVACGSTENNSPEVQAPQNNNREANHDVDQRADWPQKLVIGRGPVENEVEMNRKFQPFIDYLEEQLGVEVEYYIGTNYTAIIEAMRHGHVDIAHFPAFSYVLANSIANAESFVTTLAEPDAEGVYFSYFITLEDAGINSLTDLEGRSFVFADSGSTSGYLFPRAHIINQLGLTNDTVDNYFSNAAIAGPQEAVFVSVLNGDADAGAIADVLIDRFKETFKDHPNIDKIKVFEKTNPIPRGATSYRHDLPEDLKEAIRDAFLNVINVPELEQFLDDENMRGGYIPSDDNEFEIIRETARVLDLDLEEMN